MRTTQTPDVGRSKRQRGKLHAGIMKTVMTVWVISVKNKTVLRAGRIGNANCGAFAVAKCGLMKRTTNFGASWVVTMIMIALRAAET